MIPVVHRNEFPCSLSWVFTGTMPSPGSLDMSGSQQSDTIYFTIHDRDNPLTESYLVSIERHRVRSVEEVNQREFKIVLSPDPARTLDTLAVAISDRTGTMDSAIFFIRYRRQDSIVRFLLNTTASGAGVSGTLTGFPVVVRLNETNFDFASAESKGQDIRFRKPDGTRLPYEIERWNSAGRMAEIWVRLDTVFGDDSSHYFELYHAPWPATDSSNSVAVFDTAQGFRGVWHLSETSGTIADATALGNAGTRQGDQFQGEGVIGMAQSFDGNGDYIGMGNVLNPGTANFTVSAWVKLDFIDQTQTIIGKSNGGDPSYNYGWLFTLDNSNHFHLFMANGGITWGGMGFGAFDMYTNSINVAPSRWYNVAAVINRLTGASSKMYVDGVESTIAARGSLNNMTSISNALPLRIGAEADEERGFNGTIDEVTVSYTVRSADWIKLCYMNQKTQDALLRIR
jgi:hypothetical protein